MQHVEKPDCPVLKGEEAIAALSLYIARLEDKSDRHSEKYKVAMKKISRNLMLAIENDKYSMKGYQRPSFWTFFKERLCKDVPFIAYFYERAHRETQQPPYTDKQIPMPHTFSGNTEPVVNRPIR